MKSAMFLLKSHKGFLKLIGIIVSSGLLSAMTYIILAWSAINDAETLNSWSRDYLFAFF